MRRAVTIAVVAVALVALGLLAYNLGVFARGAPELHGTALEEPPMVANVELVAAGGEPVELGDYRGRHLLVFFGYTNCPDICPLTMARLSRIFEALGEPEDLQVVMVTVDPERDTPEVVDEYASNFHPDFEGLGGSPEVLNAAADRFYIGHRSVPQAGDQSGDAGHGAEHEPDAGGSSAAADGSSGDNAEHNAHPALIIHSSQVLLVDPQGRFTHIYNESNQAYLQEDLQALLGRS